MQVISRMLLEFGMLSMNTSNLVSWSGIVGWLEWLLESDLTGVSCNDE